MEDTIIQDIPGSDSVVAWFGYWPSFHDGNILELHLDESGQSWLKAYTFEMMTGKVDDRGYGIPEKHCTITFFFSEVIGLNLFRFKKPNVIYDLQISRQESIVRLTIYPQHGLYGFLEGVLSKVELTPGKVEVEDCFPLSD